MKLIKIILSIFRGSELSDVSIIKRMRGVEVLALR